MVKGAFALFDGPWHVAELALEADGIVCPPGVGRWQCDQTAAQNAGEIAGRGGAPRSLMKKIL
jgi:hypothetical protein